MRTYLVLAFGIAFLGALLGSGCATSQPHAGKPAAASSKAPFVAEWAEPMRSAMALERQGQLEDAYAAYQRVAQEHPSFPDVYARLGYVSQKLGFVTEASRMFAKCQDLGVPSSSEFIPELYYGVLITGGVSVAAPRSEEDLLRSEAPAKGSVFGNAERLTIVSTSPGDAVPIVDNTPQVGIGSELRFDRKEWVTFLGRQYRKGGVTVERTGVRFLEGTEILEDGLVKVLRSGSWIAAE